MIKITERVHEIISSRGHLSLSIDMTVGKGRDILFMAQRSDRVIGFDIQDLAIEETRKLLKDQKITNCLLIHDNHENISRYIDEKVDLAVYNLGYLPNGDKQIITNAFSTLNSLKALLPHMSVKGIIILVLYQHNQDEVRTIKEFTSNLSAEFDVLSYQILNRSQAPQIITIEKGY